MLCMSFLLWSFQAFGVLRFSPLHQLGAAREASDALGQTAPGGSRHVDRPPPLQLGLVELETGPGLGVL